MAGPYWQLDGDAGTNPQSDFLGTTDGQPLIIQPSGAKVGIGTMQPLHPVHVVAPGGFDDDADGVARSGSVPLVAQCDNSAIGVLNKEGRQAFALNIDQNGGTSDRRGV